MLSGILNLDKPRGMTSHDVVATVRRILGVRTVGHTGTLDPEASGVLVLVSVSQLNLHVFLKRWRKRIGQFYNWAYVLTPRMQRGQ
jgi:tRNA pseudouridine55 synthase